MNSLATSIKEIPGIKHLRKKRYDRFFARANNLNLFHGVFDNFQQAESSAPQTKILGYDNEQPAAMYDEYMEAVSSVDYPAMFWMERLKAEVTSVYDFGGHVGIKYYAYRKHLSAGTELKWTTYDLPAVVTRGRKIASQLNATKLTFSDHVSDLEAGYDMLFASGSFQYLEDPIHLLLHHLKNKPKFILINMVTLHESHSYATLQNIGPAFCPYKIFHRDSFLKQLVSYGYSLESEWKSPEKVCIIPFQDGRSILGYTGMLLRLS